MYVSGKIKNEMINLTKKSNSFYEIFYTQITHIDLILEAAKDKEWTN